jgi:membrane associated rhomboid family serine protease
MSVTIILILATVLFSMAAWREPSMFEKYSFKPYRVKKNREYLRFFSSSFLHANWSHLFFNLFTLFFFGPNIEHWFSMVKGGNGWMYFLALYISAMVISELGTFFKYRNESRYASIGASGAVSAVLFSAIWFNPTERILVMFIPMPGFAFGAIYLLYTAWAAKNDYSGQINHDAHFYGSIWGVLFTMLVCPESIWHFFESLASFRLF